MRFFVAIAICLLVWLTGCASKRIVTTKPRAKMYAKPPGNRNYYVGKGCNATAHLMNCDEATPPHCQFESVIFTKGCEQLEATK